MIPQPPLPAAHIARCVTHACWHRVHEKRRRRWALHQPWPYRWHHVAPGLKVRLANLRWCESTDNYRATNGSHWGAYQYSWGAGSAGERAGFHVRPDLASPTEQDVRTAWFWPSHQNEWSCKA